MLNSPSPRYAPLGRPVGKTTDSRLVITLVAVVASFISVTALFSLTNSPLLFYSAAIFIIPVVVFVSSVRVLRLSKLTAVFFGLGALSWMMLYWLWLSPFYAARFTVGLRTTKSLYSGRALRDATLTTASFAQCNTDSIEAVYTWVNVTDPKWQRLATESGCDVSKYTSGSGDQDPFNELKYSMRSVRKNMPFIKKFWIITERDQMPTWLDTDRMGKEGFSVKMLFHDEFMPADTVPVFNSHPIELYLFNLVKKGFIQNNPCFVYINDDFLINQHQVSPTDKLLASDGRIQFNVVSHAPIFGDVYIDLPYGAWSTEPSSEQGTYITDPHIPYVIHAGIWEEMLAACGPECHSSTHTRCHRNGSMPLNRYFDFLIQHYPSHVQLIPPLNQYNLRFPIGVTSLFTPFTNHLMIQLVKPYFVYIESHDSIEEMPEWVEFIKKFLNDSLPDPGPWEKLP